MKMHPETQYVFHSMLELGELTGEVPLVLSLIEKSSKTLVDLDAIMDAPKVSFREDINRLVDDYYESASPIEKSLIGYNLIMESSTQMNEVVQGVESVLKEAYLDKEEGVFTPLLGFRDKVAELPIKRRSIREIMLVRSQKAALESDSRVVDYLTRFKRKFDLYVSNIAHTLQESMEYIYSLEFSESAQILNDAFSCGAGSRASIPFDDSALANIRKPKKNTKKELKQLKRVFNKSLGILGRFLGPSQTRAFISGEDFRLEGERYNYILKNTGNLLSKTSQIDNHAIQYDLELYSKNWILYANLCVTFPGSPVLDQVLSTYLMITSGQEEELLKNSNFYRRTEELYLDDYIVNLKGLKKNSFTSFTNTHKSPRELFFDGKRPELRKKIRSVIVKSLGVPSVVAEELFNQELSFDEKVDYIGVGIPMPQHLDFLADAACLQE